MNLFKVLFSHAWLALRLKHDGTGMPTHFLAAFMLVSLYATLSLLNRKLSGTLDYQSMMGVAFIAQCYLFGLRNKVIGLVLLIGVITNAFSLALSAFASMSEMQLVLLSIMEFIMVFAALINVIQAEAKLQ